MASPSAVASRPPARTRPEVHFNLLGILTGRGHDAQVRRREWVPALVFSALHLAAVISLRLAVPDVPAAGDLDLGELVTYVDVPPPEAAESPRAAVPRTVAVSEEVTIPAAAGDVVHPDKAAGFQELLAPREIDKLPAPEAAAPVDERDFSGRGVVGGVAGGKPPPALPAEVAAALAREGRVSDVAGQERRGRPIMPVEMTALEVQPRLLNRREVLDLLLQKYPPPLKDMGVEGSVMVQFVVDTAGQVEPGSAFIVSSTHALFSAAAIEVAQHARFSPGRMSLEGTLVTVRSAVRAPFSWSVEK